MQWTEQPPTEPGFYWTRTKGATDYSVCEVDRRTVLGTVKLMVSMIGYDYDVELAKTVQNWKAEWCGPIAPPELGGRPE